MGDELSSSRTPHSGRSTTFRAAGALHARLGLHLAEPVGTTRRHRASSSLFRLGSPTYRLARASQTFQHFWHRWASQLAHSFVDRLPRGSNTLSNCCIDGSLLDMGAMSALPSWANVATMSAYSALLSQFKTFINGIRSMASFIARHSDKRYEDEGFLSQLTAYVQAAYRHHLVDEVVRLCGLRGGPWPLQQLWPVVLQLFLHFQKRRLTM